MPKLNLKETKSEKQDKEWRRAQREARKRAQRLDHEDDEALRPNSTRSSSRYYDRSQKGNGSEIPNYDFDEGHWTPPSMSHKQQLADDDDEFRQKLFDAMELDHGQDAAQAHFNDYVPSRWRGRTVESDPGSLRWDNPDAGDVRPELMDDEEYAEWIRYGMWAKKHKAEHEEKQRKAAEKKERKEREAKLKEESKKLEREEIERRKRGKEEKHQKHFIQSWKEYEDRWVTLRQPTTTIGDLDFKTIPWPVFPFPEAPSAITKKAVSEYLLSNLHSSGKSRKQRLKDGLLLFHPDRFEGRFLPRITVKDQELVKEAVGKVVRALNELIEDQQDV